MARKPTLRAVEPDEVAEPASLVDAAHVGNSRAMLAAMRDIVAARVQDKNTSPRDLAALTKRLMEINNDIESLDAAGGEGDIGEAIALPDEAFDEEAL